MVCICQVLFPVGGRCIFRILIVAVVSNMISRDARDFSIPCLEACFCGLSLCFIFFILLGPEHLSMSPPPPPPKQQKNTKVLQSVMLFLNLSVSLPLSISLSLFLALSLDQFFIVYCFLLKSYCSLILGVSRFSIIFLSFTLSVILFLPSPLVLCSFYVSLSICSLSLCLTLPYYILATTVVCCNLIADNALSFPLFLFDQL